MWHEKRAFASFIRVSKLADAQTAIGKNIKTPFIKNRFRSCAKRTCAAQVKRFTHSVCVCVCVLYVNLNISLTFL